MIVVVLRIAGRHLAFVEVSGFRSWLRGRTEEFFLLRHAGSERAGNPAQLNDLFFCYLGHRIAEISLDLSLADKERRERFEDQLGGLRFPCRRIQLPSLERQQERHR
jgi:hypothetical protein